MSKTYFCRTAFKLNVVNSKLEKSERPIRWKISQETQNKDKKNCTREGKKANYYVAGGFDFASDWMIRRRAKYRKVKATPNYVQH